MCLEAKEQREAMEFYMAFAFRKMEVPGELARFGDSLLQSFWTYPQSALLLKHMLCSDYVVFIFLYVLAWTID